MAVVGLVRVGLFGMTTPDGRVDMVKLSIKKLAVLPVEEIKPARPRVLFPVRAMETVGAVV